MGIAECDDGQREQRGPRNEVGGKGKGGTWISEERSRRKGEGRDVPRSPCLKKS